MAAPIRTGVSREAFRETWSEIGAFELIDGEVIKLLPQPARSGRIRGKLARFLANHVEAYNLGEIFVRLPFMLVCLENWVEGSRVPDVMFVRRERLQALEAKQPNWDEDALPMPPDLAIEVVSPTDRFSNVIRKIERYLSDGVPTAWIVDPETRSVFIYTAGSNQALKLSEQDTLEGGDLIPRFVLPLKNLSYGSNSR